MEEKKIYIPLKVSASIILYIGAGIYHSIAGALKELINNSYDADAATVSIDTHYPSYDEIHVVDDGIGMSLDEFELAMRTIGSSIKGESIGTRISAKYSRPIVGHLGIGLLALTQICEKAIIESTKLGDTTKFVAVLDFSEFHKSPSEQIEKARQDIMREKTEISKLIDRLQLFDDKAKSLLENEQLGYCIVYPDQPANKSEQGTKIILQGIKPEIVSRLRDEGRSLDGIKKFTKRDILWAEHLEELRREYSWKDICNELRQKSGMTFQSLPYYYHFIWELGLETPVQYFDDAPITMKNDILASKKEELNKYNFSLVIDGHTISKPTLLPSGELIQEKVRPRQGYDYKIENIKFDKIVDNEQLTFEGYVYWQRSQILPDAQRGIQVYIRNTGIGAYDKSLLGYTTVNPASRAGQVSGEVYVSRGLERALNIDRKSFRETDAHYVALQHNIWEILGSTSQSDGLFGESVKAYYRRKDLQLKQELVQHKEELTELVSQLSTKGIHIKFFEDSDNPLPYEISNHKISLNMESPQWPKSTQEKKLAQKILATAQIAILEHQSLETFVRELERILLKGD